MHKGTRGHLGFRITKIQGHDQVISSKWHRMLFHWPSKSQKPSTEHHCYQIFRNVFKIAYGGHFGIKIPRIQGTMWSLTCSMNWFYCSNPRRAAQLPQIVKMNSKRQWRPSWISDNKGLRQRWGQINKMTSNLNSWISKPQSLFIEQHYKPNY